MERNLTTEEVIKRICFCGNALRGKETCDNCPYFNKGCDEALHEDAIKVINALNLQDCRMCRPGRNPVQLRKRI